MVREELGRRMERGVSMEWNMSKSDLEMGLSRLKQATYPQKTYCPLPRIKEIDPLFPLTRYEFYGVVSDRRFVISPVLLGFHKNVSVLYGTITRRDTECQLTVEVKLPRATRLVWWLYMVLCLFFAYILVSAVETSGGIFREAMITLGCLLGGILVRAALQWTVNNQAQRALTVLQRMFNINPM